MASNSPEQLSASDSWDRCREIYNRDIKPLLSEADKDKHVCVDVASGNFELGDDPDIANRLRATNKDAHLLCFQLGYVKLHSPRPGKHSVRIHYKEIPNWLIVQFSPKYEHNIVMSYDDPRWNLLHGGYKQPYSPVPILKRLGRGEDVWNELWENLHHQGDIGEASYSAVPHLVRLSEELVPRTWQIYGLVPTIEIERYRKTNPPLPDWLSKSYSRAIRVLLTYALLDIDDCNDAQNSRSIVGFIALSKGLREIGKLISHTDDSEFVEILNQYDDWSETYL